MAEKKIIPEDEELSNSDLAFIRTVIAEERTLMAWIRTAISLFSFGFTIYKFFQEGQKEMQHLLSAREVGLIMIGMGLLGLLLAQIDHYNAIKHLKKRYPIKRRPVTGIMSILVWAFGLALFLAAIYKY